jgi:hypothetical protein
LLPGDSTPVYKQGNKIRASLRQISVILSGNIHAYPVPNSAPREQLDGFQATLTFACGRFGTNRKALMCLAVSIASLFEPRVAVAAFPKALGRFRRWAMCLCWWRRTIPFEQVIGNSAMPYTN